jgi:hypothetical protein
MGKGEVDSPSVYLVPFILQSGNWFLPASVAKVTEEGGTEVMGRLAQSLGLEEKLVILGVVMATEELMGKCSVPMETGSVAMGTLEGNSQFP